MMENNNSENLRLQLKELNIRSRWYTNQIWYVPFAFFGLVVVLFSKIGTLKPDYLTVLLFLIPINIGIGVLFFMNSLADGIRRSVINIRQIEKALGLKPTAQYRRDYIWSLCFIVFMTVLICIVILSVLLLGG